METIDLMKEGFRRAPSRDEKVFESAQLFARGRTGASPLAQAVLVEAFSTSDFPILLGDAFEKQALKAYKDTPLEFESIVTDTTVDSFVRRKLVDLWGADAFERVNEGEEYKGATLSETEIEHGAGKWGRSYGLTWELRLARRFSDMADFPRSLGNGARKTQNNVVADTLVDTTGWAPGFFGTVDDKPFTPENLDAAIKALALRENHRGELVETSDLVLVHGPALRAEVARILTAARIVTKVTNGSKVTETEVDNPYRSIVTPLESRTVANRLGAAHADGWALVQGKSSDLPSIIRTKLAGHPDVDIRVKRDQGQSVGGGEVSIEDGSFNDDTIWYRGRSVVGIDAGFTEGVYASNGS
ncbi:MULTISPECIES: hypothetical protein [unclassified Brevibacterium]|uniref:phage major capsid protein n=1 Tax=unclassified Brevibacterium TaxID=2614124 RepID=UPI001E559A3F|nr:MULTISPECIES: hypothetical protein [unclassified Brevibacterium]MCD1287335.1 hypothetical protein [Brevibacterium sp. CCUG 69071]MDK8436410.1 hypothetical protein [Brevibacterium sp. H-BE7]